METIASPALVAETFRNAFLSEESGVLTVRSGGTTYSIFFDRGLVAGAQTDHPGESAPEGGGRRTVQLVERAFSCIPELVEFHPTQAPTEDSESDILSTVELFLAGVRAMSGFEDIREALVGLDQRLVLRPNPSVPLERLTLKPIHGFVLSRLSGGMSFGDIAATVGTEDELEAARFVFSLLLLGSVVADPPFPHGLLKVELLINDHRRAFAREEAELAFVREMYAAVTSQNPYQILGIEGTANSEEIRKAYEEHKRALQSDRFLARVRERMRRELTIIECRLTEVFLALQGGASSHDGLHEEDLDLETLSLRRELSKTEVAATLDEQERLAESYYQKAKKYFGTGDYYNCIQYCQQAVRQVDQEPRYHFLLAEAQARNPDRRWQKMAEQAYLNAIKLDPWNADYLVILGQFYRKQGFAVRARRQFEKALAMQPGHARAQEELATIS